MPGLRAAWKKNRVAAMARGSEPDGHAIEQTSSRRCASLKNGTATPSSRHRRRVVTQVSAWAALRRDGVPSARYLGIIEEGARELGLVEYADALSKRPRANPSRFLRAVAGAHGVVSLTLYRRNLSHLLAPLRSACFVLTYGGRRPWLRALSEALTAAVLLPTAAVGSVIRLYRSAQGLPPIVFGPPE